MQSLDAPELLVLHEQALTKSISIEITNTPFEEIATANVEMLRKEILRRIPA